MPTKIEWTDESWNPVIGCSPAGAGCTNCYAARMAARLERMGREEYRSLVRDGRWTGKTRLVPDRLYLPLRWKRPRRIFTCSMGDLFHESVDEATIAWVWAVMGLASQHTFQVLTKRPERMRRLLSDPDFVDLVDTHVSMTLEDEESPVGPGRGWNGLERWSGDARATAPVFEEGSWPNVWTGASASTQPEVDRVAVELARVPAAVRFLSLEPLLGAVDLDCWPESGCPRGWLDIEPGIDWVIVGGESGPGARPMQPQWARTIRDQCVAAGVPFFFKQWGEWGSAPSDGPDGMHFGHFHGDVWVPGEVVVSPHDGEPTWNRYRVGKRAAGRHLDGRTWDEMPAIPSTFEAWRDWHRREKAAGNTLTAEEVDANRKASR